MQSSQSISPTDTLTESTPKPPLEAALPLLIHELIRERLAQFRARRQLLHELLDREALVKHVRQRKQKALPLQLGRVGFLVQIVEVPEESGDPSMGEDASNHRRPAFKAPERRHFGAHRLSSKEPRPGDRQKGVNAHNTNNNSARIVMRPLGIIQIIVDSGRTQIGQSR